MKSHTELLGVPNHHNLLNLLYLNSLLKNKLSSTMPSRSPTLMPQSFLRDGMLMSKATSSSTSPRWKTTGR